VYNSRAQVRIVPVTVRVYDMRVRVVDDSRGNEILIAQIAPIFNNGTMQMADVFEVSYLTVLLYKYNL
jgi:hypothetical protein